MGSECESQRKGKRARQGGGIKKRKKRIMETIRQNERIVYISASRAI